MTKQRTLPKELTKQYPFLLTPLDKARSSTLDIFHFKYTSARERGLGIINPSYEKDLLILTANTRISSCSTGVIVPTKGELISTTLKRILIWALQELHPLPTDCRYILPYKDIIDTVCIFKTIWANITNYVTIRARISGKLTGTFDKDGLKIPFSTTWKIVENKADSFIFILETTGSVHKPRRAISIRLSLDTIYPTFNKVGF